MGHRFGYASDTHPHAPDFPVMEPQMLIYHLCRIRHILHRGSDTRRIPLRAHRRSPGHHPRPHAPQPCVKVQHSDIVVQVRPFPRRKDALGRQHERPAAGCPVGSGLRRGADDCRAGEDGAGEPASAKRGMWSIRGMRMRNGMNELTCA